MNILVIGGNRFFGRQLVTRLLAEGHDVTVMNRGNVKSDWGERAPHFFRGDRNDRAALTAAAELKYWDVVYDQVCYEASQARVAAAIFKPRTKKFIFTSSQAAYPKGSAGLRETDFDPRTYKFTKDADCKTQYGEAKRQCEAVFHHMMPGQAISVRFPIVVGLDDYSERLHNHVRAMLNESPVHFPSMDAEISLISSAEAARTLSFLADSDYRGPVNATSPDKFTIRSMINMVAEVAGKRPRFAGPSEGFQSWFDWRSTYTMDTGLLNSLGLRLTPMPEWLPDMIKSIAEKNPPAPRLNLDFTSAEITGTVAQEIKSPFRILRFENFFSPELHGRLVRTLNERLAEGTYDRQVPGKFCRSDAQVTDGQKVNRYGAYINRIQDKEESPFAIFYSKVFFDFMQSHYSFPFSPHVMGSVHHHKINSPTGWVHNDYHYCNFPWNPTPEGLNPWTVGAHYQQGYDPRPHILKCQRAVAVMYYFGNEEHHEGDGGETCFFKSMDWADLFLKIPPKNNSLCAFEVGPDSYHTFITNTRTVRNSVAFWFHTEQSVAMQRFGVAPLVGRG